MKKTLFSCVALTCLWAGTVAAQPNDKKTLDASPVVKNQVETSTLQEKVVAEKIEAQKEPSEDSEIKDSSRKMYSMEENTILEGFENYLYLNNMDVFSNTDIRAEGKDYVIILSNPQNPEQKSVEIKMTRIDDFMGKAQYKISHDSWERYKKQVTAYTGQDNLSINTFSEEISWLPELGILTNQSTKASDIKVQVDDIMVSIQSAVSDSLIRSNGDKMDTAAMTSIQGIKVATPYAVLEIPSETQNLQMTGSDLSADGMMQALTATNVQFSNSTPTISISLPMMPGQTLTAKMETNGSFVKDFNINAVVSDIKLSGNNMIMLPLLPQMITSKITAEGISKDLLIAYLSMHDQLDEMAENSPEAVELEKKLVLAQDQLFSTLVLKVNELSVTNETAGIKVTGQIKYAEPSFNADLKVEVTNFDLISPKAPPINKKACEEAIKRMTGQERQLPTQCIQNGGVLEALRPYLTTERRTQNAKGQPVDIFDIVYTANALTVNGQIVFSDEPTKSAEKKEIADEAANYDEAFMAVDAQKAVNEPQNETVAVDVHSTNNAENAPINDRELEEELAAMIVDEPQNTNADSQVAQDKPQEGNADVLPKEGPAENVVIGEAAEASSEPEVIDLPKDFVESDQILEAQKLLDSVAPID